MAHFIGVTNKMLKKLSNEDSVHVGVPHSNHIHPTWHPQDHQWPHRNDGEHRYWQVRIDGNLLWRHCDHML